MARAQTPLEQDAQYGPFLYAAMGKDRCGTSVSVLSMLARLGVNPWGEASNLASLPEGAAQQRLEALMARFDDVQTHGPDRSTTVSTLLGFLPRRAPSARSLPQAMPAGLALPPLASWVVIAALFLVWIAMLAQTR